MEKTDCNHDDGDFFPPTDTFDPTTPFFDSFLSSSHASSDRNTQRDRKKGNPLLLLCMHVSVTQVNSSSFSFASLTHTHTLMLLLLLFSLFLRMTGLLDLQYHYLLRLSFKPD